MSSETSSGGESEGSHLPRGSQLHLLLDDELQQLPLLFGEELEQTFHKAGKTGTLPLRHCKVLLVGDAGVGKTSLRKHLMGEHVLQDQPSTVGIESFDVESFDVGTDWKKQKKTCDELNRNAAWWLVSHYSKDLINTNPRAKYILKTKFWGMLLVYIVQVLMAVVPLRDGFIYGFFFYYMFFLILVVFILRDFWISYGPASLIMIYMVLADAVIHKRIGDYEEWPRSLTGILCFCLFLVTVWVLYFTLGCFGLSGILFCLCIMNAPGETDLISNMSANTAFTGQYLQFDPLFLLQVISSHMGHLVGISLTAVIHLRKCDLKFKFLIFLLCNIMSLIILSFSFKPLQSFAVGIPVGNIILLSLESGRQTCLRFGLGIMTKTISSVLVGLIFGFVIEWKICFSWKFVLGLPFLMANGYLWYKLHGRTGSKTWFPTAEFLKAYQVSKSGVKDLPIMFTLMDFAGQKDYYQMHHIFMVDMAVYCLVFNLQDAVDDLDTQYKRIIFWLTKIRLHAGRNQVPAVLLVGTHRDSLQSSNSETEINIVSHEITKRIQSSRANTDWLFFNNRNGTILFTVENLINASRDEGLSELKASIQHTAHTLCGQKEHHLSWLEVVRICKELSAQGQKIMLVKQLWEKVRNDLTLNEITDISEFQKCLILANQAGHIFYRGVSDLQNFVVLDQCFLMDIMKRFLDPSPAWALKLSAHWELLQREGIATWKVIAHIIEEAIQEQSTCYSACMKLIQSRFRGTHAKSNFNFLVGIVEYLKEIDFIHELNQESVASKVDKPYKKKIPHDDANMTLSQKDKSSHSSNECESSDEKYACNGSHKEIHNIGLEEGTSSLERMFLIPSKLSPCSEVPHQEKPALELFIDCEDTPVADVYPRFIACVLNKTTDIHKRVKHKPRVFSNTATVEDPDLGAVQIETFNDNPDQQLLCLRMWPLQEGAVKKALDSILKHFDLTVEQYFPFISYTVGVLCPNSRCNEMATKTYKHIMPITNYPSRINNNSTSEQKEGCSNNMKTLAMCGTKSYQIKLTSWTLCVKQIRPALQENSYFSQNILVQRSNSFEEPLDGTVQTLANVVVSHALCEWKDLSRALGVAECDINAIEYAHPRSLKEQCRQGIWTWWKRSEFPSDENKLQHVIHVLRQQKLAMPADVLEDHFFGEESQLDSPTSHKIKPD